MNKEQFTKDIETIKFSFEQYHMGWHLTPKEWREFRLALKRVNKLRKVIPAEVGII